ncbi:DNA adenine methylase [Helicobacter apodemus]|uniref:DNA adenine methylase n=1 Tax=Helicobacter apodemus TaxID=135569 RepID=A0A4U8UCY6_9HELI|nr:DNA adenine methylase [Helicobacter apodemus]TLE14456.1 DNA adenine methylase [Helicobacter apodemus]
MKNANFKMKTSTLKAPFASVGGKSKMAKEIVERMPPHTCYAEVFAGSLSVLYAKERPFAKYNEVINDWNEDLINLHKIIQSRPQSLQLELNRMLSGRIFFKDSITKTPRNDIEKAALYYYSIVHSFGGTRRHYAMCKKARSPKNIYKSFQVYAERLKHVSIENLDFRDFIKQYDNDSTLFYLDPPYVGTENYYKNKKTFDLKDHKDLFEILKNIKGKFLLSYNDCELVNNLYKDFNIKKLQTHYSLNIKTQYKRHTELLISNF